MKGFGPIFSYGAVTRRLKQAERDLFGESEKRHADVGPPADLPGADARGRKTEKPGGPRGDQQKGGR